MSIEHVLDGHKLWHVQQGDALAVLSTMAGKSVQTCVTSPPYYGLRDYGVTGQIGLETSPQEYVDKMVAVFRKSGSPQTLSGLLRVPLDSRVQGSSKQLLGIPWRVAFALQDDGWYLRSDIIWHKPAPMPESVKDRPTRAHEYIFLLSKQKKYYYDVDAIREPHTDIEGIKHCKDARRGTQGYAVASGFHGNPQRSSVGGLGYHTAGRNKRSVWTVNTVPYSEAHFATFPPKLIEPCILAGSREGDVVLDPFSGAGTTGMVAIRHSRRYVGIELNPEYVTMSESRLMNDAPLFNGICG